jgi:hypothetical protein
VSVEFFSKEGVRLGDRASLAELIHHITNLPLVVLRGAAPLSNFSVKERLDWVGQRETTKAEDKAYSLLGLFGVYMPLLYGEGQANAIARLQREIGGEGAGIPRFSIRNVASDTVMDLFCGRTATDTPVYGW